MREVPLQGYAAHQHSAVTLVDDADYERVMESRWYLHLPKLYPACYAVRHFQGSTKHTTEFLHNFIMGCIGIDHRDGNRLNNQRSNLRVATAAGNAANCAGNARTSSNYKGVSWRTRGATWVAQIQADRRKLHIGYFRDETAAARAYDAVAASLFGEFARLNFPEVSDE